ncbi:sulfide:quinone oxidoreductase, mitochondrial [Plodia interpunctella]|uniref:sulfide:quinone oxidoreductase, mitochondrial n=1 Tax=Plodia interpunctella TaxID=58824 RepID=UPI002368C953|nr:sulfide:quinone oxidoreductase, mitochondrial [Plodia interpunctella]
MNIIRKLSSISSAGIHRNFSVSSVNNAKHSCKLLVIGGGSGGCTIAAKFVRRLKAKHSVIVLEPNTDHYYQPLWTLVGAGVKPLCSTRRPEGLCLPEKAKWLRDSAECINPKENFVKTAKGDTIEYEFLVVAVGIENDYEKIPGLCEALLDRDSSVSTIFSWEFAEKTASDLKKFRGGDAIFTYPDTLIKCPGAPQKIAYLAESFFTKSGVRPKTNVMYNTSLPVIFGVKKYADALMHVVRRKNIRVNYKMCLTQVIHDRKQAVFVNKANNQETTVKYDLLHVAPPMRAPTCIRCNKELTDDQGYLSVDKYTLQHTSFKNIYGIGDCTNTPNSKTAAAVAKQSYVLEQNLLNTMNKSTPKERYNGYGACPLLTSYSTCILAEFLYDGVVHETIGKCKVLVVGGGTGGCSVAARLARRMDPKEIMVLEPSRVHYYQPMFALIAAGIRPSSSSQKPMKSVLPQAVSWLQDEALEFQPAFNSVRTKHRKTIEYEYMVIALGVKNDYEKIVGLKQALNYPSSGVCTIYSDGYCVKAWSCIKNFRGGHAIFTFPKTTGKCPGAAQKIMYLADDFWRQHNKLRSVANITYNTGGVSLFGIEKYAKELQRVVKSRGIAVNCSTDLIALEDGKAIFEDDKGTKVALPYNFLHVTPPMSPPCSLKTCPCLVNEAGFLKVDPHTLQHTAFPNVYGIGDCMDTPNSKTAAAVAVQSAVLEQNLLGAIEGEPPRYKYNGYSACPMMTSYTTGIISEFLYDKKICETFPFDQSKEGRLVVYLNKYVFPYLYWNRLLTGKYSGPAAVRRFINPLGR